jgi:uncharacterized SAM-binding protein YcdF (DUF218 family)
MHTNSIPLFASISVYSWFLFAFVLWQRFFQPRIDTNAHEFDPFYSRPLASIRGFFLLSFFGKGFSNRESTRMNTNSIPLFASISVHSWLVFAFVLWQGFSNREWTRMHTNSIPFIRVYSWFLFAFVLWQRFFQPRIDTNAHEFDPFYSRPLASIRGFFLLWRFGGAVLLLGTRTGFKIKR